MSVTNLGTAMDVPRCKNGHPRTPENVNKDRRCKLCKAEQQKRIYTTKEYQKVRMADQTHYRKTLSDQYIRALLQNVGVCKYSEATPEIIENKRAEILERRQRLGYA